MTTPAASFVLDVSFRDEADPDDIFSFPLDTAGADDFRNQMATGYSDIIPLKAVCGTEVWLQRSLLRMATLSPSVHENQFG